MLYAINELSRKAELKHKICQQILTYVYQTALKETSVAAGGSLAWRHKYLVCDKARGDGDLSDNKYGSTPRVGSWKSSRWSRLQLPGFLFPHTHH